MFRFGFKIGISLKKKFFLFILNISRRTKWRKKHAAEMHGATGGGKHTKQRNDGSIPPIESDSNST